MANIDELLRERGLKPVFIINGNQGPTGKTYLCNKLRELGYEAYEEWLLQELGYEKCKEWLLQERPQFRDDLKKEKSDGNSCVVTITLNEPISVK